MRAAIISAALAVTCLVGTANAQSSTTKKESTTTTTSQPATGGSGDMSSTTTTTEENSYLPAQPAQPQPYVAPANQHQISYSKERGMKGASILAGGGLEGFSGALANQISAGAAWGVRLGAQPTRVVGVEANYTGAEMNSRGALNGSGSDLVRNGIAGDVTVGLPTAIQPYALAGIGWNHFTARTSRFKSDDAGEVPLGVGVRARAGNFTADLRGTYDLGFDENYAQNVPTTGINNGNTGRMTGLLSLGAIF